MARPDSNSGGASTFAHEDETEMTSIQVQPDAASLEDQMRLLADKMGLLPDDLTSVLRDLELVRVEVFGIPGERAGVWTSRRGGRGSVYVQASLCGWLHQPRQRLTQRLAPRVHGMRSAPGSDM
jgi:hypothetical protein